jgi:hypothetical protein
MCSSKSKNSGASTASLAAPTPPQIIDTGPAQKVESSLRRSRSGYSNLFKTGSRLGDTKQPNLSVKALLGS